MDFIYNAGYYLALFLMPFVIYFLFFWTRHKRSPYSNKDWFYFMQILASRNAVKKYQAKYRARAAALGKNLELDMTIPTKKHSIQQCIYGVDQKGNSLSIRFSLMDGNVAEAVLYLRLVDGRTYAFPGGQNIYQTNLAKKRWRINSLNVEILEPFLRLRITFSGLLQDLSCKDYEKIEHVQFNFIFNSSGSPVHFPQDVDTNLLSNALASENWRDGSWIDFLVDQSDYQQFGALQGFVKSDALPEESVLNLPTSRSTHRGIDDRFLLDRELRLFIADTYGNLINLVIKSFTKGCSQLNYGSVILSRNVILTLTGLDIRLIDVGQHRNIPEMITIHVEARRVSFKCIVHLNRAGALKAVNNFKYGYECYNLPAECDVNANQARALVEFWYQKRGEAEFEPEHRLTPKTVDIIPDILTTNITSEEARILELTGGKGNSLALLASLKSKDYVVPDGFIITVSAYQQQVRSNPVFDKLISFLDDICCGRGEGKLEDACKETVAYFKKERIAPRVAQAVIEELDKDNENRSKWWAVRSSAVGEDSEELSAAGQNETFLGCRTDEQILKSVSACWASLYTYQSVSYRWQHGLPIITEMAVVVQEMVPADSAGVLFTCQPTSSNPSQMVITSNYGLGETVVSGASDPDTFVLNRTWDDKVCPLDHKLGVKNKVLRMTDGGVKEVDASNEPAEEKWSISKLQVVRLAEVGILVEKAFGSPRDIEWALYEDRVFLLQARPITTLSNWSEFELTHELDYPVLTDHSVFTVANVGEVIPCGMTVLSQTSSFLHVEKSVQLHAHKYCDPFTLRCILRFQHRATLDVVNTIHMTVTPEIAVSSTILDLAIFGHPVLDERIKNIVVNRRGYSSALRRLKEPWRVFRTALRNQATCNEVKTLSSALKIDINKYDPLLVMYEKIEAASDDLLEIAFGHAKTTSVNVFYQIVAMNILLEGRKELTSEHYGDFALMLSSCDDVVSAEVPTYLEKIAQIVRDEGYNEEFCSIEPQYGTAWLRRKCPEAHRLFVEFLDKHGHRSLGEFEMMEVSWAEDPSKVISMVQANANNETIVSKRSRSVDEIIRNLVSPKKASTRRVLKFLMTKIRTAVGIREQTKSELVRSLNKLRMAYRLLGEAMASQGILPSKHLIYHLTHYEIGDLIRRRNPLLITKAIKRQKLYPKWKKLKFPEVIFGVPIPENESVAKISPTGKVCVGTPVCVGSTTARACVITSLDQIDQLQTGDVLITYCTDIGWSPYFPMLSGIVTEIGGLVSHGAVVAREYGLPCIVGIKNVTSYFKTGDIVSLNGNTGELGRI